MRVVSKLRIDILAVGKLKERYLLDAQKEYLKRLQPYAKTQVIEVADESIPENASPATVQQALEREAVRLARNLREGTFIIALDRKGREMSSEELAASLDDLAVRGNSHLAFIIGGSEGLSDKLLSRSNWRLSFSRLTFPHQLTRIILLEQIYRTFRIRRGEPYHK